MNRITKFVKKFVYFNGEFSDLNRFTLHISNPELKKEMDKARAENFDKLWMPAFIFESLLIISRIY